MDERFWVTIDKIEIICFLTVLRTRKAGHRAPTQNRNSNQCSGAIQVRQIRKSLNNLCTRVEK